MKKTICICVAGILLFGLIGCQGEGLPGGENLPLQLIVEAPTEAPQAETVAIATAHVEPATPEPLPLPTPTPEPPPTDTPEPTLDPEADPTPTPDPGAVSDKAQQLANLALSLIGKPYQRGGITPQGFDTSGLVYYCLNEMGEKTARQTSKGFSETSSWKKINDTKHLQPGDLIFYMTGESTEINCVCIYVGDGQMVYASTSEGAVVKDSITKKYWISSFAFAKRVF
ncbi:MAG: C40 family peptidase [Clostridiales bacterium]|nr:C40 family peptidase [Clostridiales bacterium]